MMKKFLSVSTTQLLLGLICLICVMATQVNADDRDTTMKVSGVISKFHSGLISVTTSWGHMSIQSDGLAEAKVGDELTLWVSGNNVAVDHHAKGKKGVHRLITDKLTYTSGDKKEIKLMTPEGERSFPVQHGESKLSTIEEGTPIAVELNEAGNVIEIRKAA